MGRKRIPRKNRIYIAPINQARKGFSCATIKGKRWPHNPNNFAMFLFIFKQFHNLFIVTCKRSLTCFILTKRKGLGIILFFKEAIGVDIDAFTCVFTSPTYHKIPYFKMGKLTHKNLSIFIYRNTIHTTFFRK